MRQTGPMKKSLAFISLALCIALSACGAQTRPQTPPESAASPTTAQSHATEAADLTGNWKQTNSLDPDAYQAATIDEDSITINWVTNSGDTTSLYWVGTFKASGTSTDSHSWTSKRDHKATDSAILASGDDTKKFTFKDGEISYEAGIMGTTTTVRLHKQSN